MGFAALRDHKYISLETFKKSGEGVKTPVWFAADPSVDLSGDGALLYIYTIGNTGKVKRIRNNGHVKIAPCTIKGVPLGDPVDAKAEIVTGEVASKAMRLLKPLLPSRFPPWHRPDRRAARPLSCTARSSRAHCCECVSLFRCSRWCRCTAALHHPKDQHSDRRQTRQ